MKMPMIEPAALARLAGAGSAFSVSAQPEDDGWIIYVHDEQGDRALLDVEGRAAAIFNALEAVAQRLRTLGIDRFEVKDQLSTPGYEDWLRAEVQEALDDPSPLVPHAEAMRRIRAALKAK
jgi:hypothetical protein